MSPEIPLPEQRVRAPFSAERGSRRKSELRHMSSDALRSEVRAVIGSDFEELSHAEERYRTDQVVGVVLDTFYNKSAEEFGRVIITKQKPQRRPLREMTPVATEQLLGFLVPIAEKIDGEEESGHYLAVLKDKNTEKSKVLVVKPCDENAQDIYSRKGPHLVVHGSDPVESFEEEYVTTGMEVVATSDEPNDKVAIDAAVLLAMKFIDHGTEMQIQKLHKNHIEDAVRLFGREIEDFVAGRKQQDLPIIEDQTGLD